jgi:undecaprenyl-diphosphatase
MTPLDAVLLGILRGTTEFLPVSSDGHLELLRLLFDISAAPLAALSMQLGTVLAALVVLRRATASALIEGSRALVRPHRFKRNPGARDALVVAVAAVPGVAVVIGMRRLIGVWHAPPLVVGLGFVATCAILISTRWVRRGRDEAPALLGAFALGVIQGFGVLPGLSQSGAAVSVALWLGVRPDRAFELSVMTGIPISLGAVATSARADVASGSNFTSALLAGVCAAAFGVVALLILRHATIRGRLFLFALWVFPVAVATLALARAWPAS